MSTQVQIRRGNTAQTAAFTGAIAELTVDTDKKVVVVHDGTTAGGIPLSKESTASTIFNHANGAFTVANSATITAQAAFNQANSVYLPSVTRLDVTHSGSSAYSIDQYTGNNPELYIRAGETLAFNLAVTGHPFLIRVSSGGTLYNVGLTHVTTTGTVTTGSSAQAQVTGTLYWKVPAELAGNTYVYQCQIHGGMVGNIVIERPNQANSSAVYANAAFDKANSANVLAQNAYNYANTIISATGAYAHANGAFDKANSANILAQNAYNFANTISGGAAIDNVARATANSATTLAQAAFNQANTDFTTISTTAGVYGNATFVPVITLAANGRISSITNTAISSSGASIGDVLALAIALG